MELEKRLEEIICSILKLYDLTKFKYGEFLVKFHSIVCERVLGYLTCYKDFVDSNFDIVKIGIPIASDIEVKIINNVVLSFYEKEFNNAKGSK